MDTGLHCLPLRRVSTRVSSRLSRRSSSLHALEVATNTQSDNEEARTRQSVQFAASPRPSGSQNVSRVPTLAGRRRRSGLPNQPTDAESGNATTRPLIAFPGHGAHAEPYGGFEGDDALYLPDGDVLIRGERDRLFTFAVSSQVLLDSRLPHFFYLLHNAQTKPSSTVPNSQLRQRSPGHIPPPEEISDISLPHLTPQQRAVLTTHNRDSMPRYVKCITLRSLPSEQERFKAKLSFRNILAMLYGAPLVNESGNDLYSTLLDLERTVFRFGGNADEIISNAILRRVGNYASSLGYFKVAEGDVQHGINVLALCAPGYRMLDWIYQYAFSRIFKHLEPNHFTSMEYTERLDEKHQRILHQAWTAYRPFKEKALRHLNQFQFPELSDQLPSYFPGVKAAFEEFRRIVVEHYQLKYLSWPPTERADWLTPMLIADLQSDFAELYDALVDYDVTWREVDATQSPYAGPKTDLVLRTSLGVEIPNAWAALIRCVNVFDKHLGLDHMPFPAPMFPHRSFEQRKRIFGDFLDWKRRTKLQLKPSSSDQAKLALNFEHTIRAPEPTHARDSRKPRRHSISLPDRPANSPTTGGPLLKKLVDHEKTAEIRSVSFEALQDARLGRWLLIYGVLQTVTAVAEEYWNPGDPDYACRAWTALNLDAPFAKRETPMVDMRRLQRAGHPLQAWYARLEEEQELEPSPSAVRHSSLPSHLISALSMGPESLNVVPELSPPERASAPSPDPEKSGRGGGHVSRPSGATGWETVADEEEENVAPPRPSGVSGWETVRSQTSDKDVEANES